jgi:hypothetical protein
MIDISCPTCEAKKFFPSVTITDINARIGYDEKEQHFYVLSDKMTKMNWTCENGHKFERDARKDGYVK